MDWLENEIARGLSGLVIMRTPGHPPAEQIQNVARVWSGALAKTRKWDETQDVDRIREAFRQLVLAAKRWPTVSEFLEVLPMRGAAPAQTVPVQRQLAHNTKIDERGDAAHRARMLEMFNRRMAEHVRSPDRIAMLESELSGTVRRGRKLHLPHTDNSIHGEWVPCKSLAEALARSGTRTVV